MKSLLFLLLTGCGSFTVNVPKSDSQDTSEPAAAPAEAAPAVESSPTEVVAPEFKFSERGTDWDTAVKEAPEGWRLPTQQELWTAFNAGQIQVQGGFVWTSDSSADNEDYKIAMSEKFGTFEVYSKTSQLAVLYIKDGEAKAGITLQYVEHKVNWATANAGAPKGFHLPSKKELDLAFDAGLLKDYEATVWTSDVATDRSDYRFWFRIKDGFAMAYDTDSLFSALYFKDDPNVTAANDAT